MLNPCKCLFIVTINFWTFFGQVPQQKNEYDCGLFVLYFIERFIIDAPDRFTNDDLAMVSIIKLNSLCFQSRFWRTQKLESGVSLIFSANWVNFMDFTKHNHLFQNSPNPYISMIYSLNC